MLVLAQRAHNVEVVQFAAAEVARFAEGSDKPLLLGNAEMAKGNLAFFDGYLDGAGVHFAAAAREYERAIELGGSVIEPPETDPQESRERIEFAKHMLSLT